MKIACLWVTPKWHSGIDTAFTETIYGLRALGHDVTVVGCVYRKYHSDDDFRARCGWRPRALELVDEVVRVRNWRDLSSALAGYDGVVLSDVYFAETHTPEMLVSSTDMATWTSGFHINDQRKGVMPDFHARNAVAPKWSGAFVYFWHTVQEVHSYPRWYRAVLPYRVDASRAVPALSDREYDFAFTSRLDPRKGAIPYVSALEGLTRRGAQFRARMDGSSNEFPGGPYSHTIAMLLESWGWKVRRSTEKLRGPWLAEDPKTGSELQYGGQFEPNELEGILFSSKRLVNTTSAHESNSHLEYTSLEGLAAGCRVLAKTDWSDYHYPDGGPSVVDLPEKSYRLTRKNGSPAFNSTNPDAIDNVYDELTDVFERELCAVPADVDHAAAFERDREIIARAHDPSVAASAYAQVLRDAAENGGKVP